MNHLLFLLCCMTFFVAATGQSNYEAAIRQGDSAFKKAEYKIAINKYFAAEAFDPSKKNLVKEKVNKVFDRIETLRKEADAAKNQVIASLNKSQKLIDAFYFYDNKFALAFKDEYFYFIDKNGNKIEKLGRWSQAGQFDKTGFAKVKVSDGSLLLKDNILDTFGNHYPIAYDIKDIDNSILALDLSNRERDSIPEEVLAHLPLKVLILNSGLGRLRKSKNLTADIGRLKNLEYLQLGLCKFTSLPGEIGELKNLITLNLSGNLLKSLPPQIGELKKLVSLDLGGSFLDSLPRQIGELKNLNELFGNGNRLRSLPSEIGELKNLTILDLTRNELDSLPPQIRKLVKLTTLGLSQNNLSNLPVQIGELKNLRTLNLSHNNLSSLPAQIGELENLEILNIAYNEKLTTLPFEISKLKKLKILYYRWTPLSDKAKSLLPKGCKALWSPG